MWLEDLKGWIWQATKRGKMVMHQWEKLVRLVQLEFAERELKEEFTWEKMVLFPKGMGEYWGIMLVEVAWKLCAAVLNLRMKRGVYLHDSLHWFWERWGTETETLKANLDHQLLRLAHKPLFQVFLDVQKSYNVLNRGRCLEILRGYKLRKTRPDALDNTGRSRGYLPRHGVFWGGRLGLGGTSGNAT